MNNEQSGIQNSEFRISKKLDWNHENRQRLTTDN